MYSDSFWAQSCISITLCFIAISQELKYSNQIEKRQWVLGFLILYEKEAFLKTLGFEWLKMEVADDIGLGPQWKESGAISHFYTAFEDVQVEWYPSLSSVVHGLEKNAYSQIMIFSASRTFVFYRNFCNIRSRSFFGNFGLFGFTEYYILFSNRHIHSKSNMPTSQITVDTIFHCRESIVILYRSSFHHFGYNTWWCNMKEPCTRMKS